MIYVVPWKYIITQNDTHTSFTGILATTSFAKSIGLLDVAFPM